MRRMFLLAAIGVFALAGCGHRCAKGHYETRPVPDEVFMQTIIVGDSIMLVPITIPAHDEQVWVCDEVKPSPTTR